MQNRTFITHAPPQEESVEESEASSDTDAVTGKDHRKIAHLAYTLYEQRGREDGYDLHDWLEAEQRLVSRGEGRGF